MSGSGRWWPVAVVAVLGVTVAANAYLLIAANDPQSAVVEPDYYRRALAWDSTAALAAASARLGWRADAAIGSLDEKGRAPVRVTLRDSLGGPVSGAEVSVTAIHNRDAGHHVVAALVEAADGYVARLPLERPGLWELRVEARRGAEHFVADLRRDAGGDLRP